VARVITISGLSANLLVLGTDTSRTDKPIQPESPHERVGEHIADFITLEEFAAALEPPFEIVGPGRP